MPKTKTEEFMLTAADEAALTRARALAKSTSDALIAQHSDIRKLGDTLNVKNFLVREYPGRFNNGCDRGGRRLACAAHVLDVVIRNVPQIRTGKAVEASGLNDTYDDLQHGQWKRGKAIADTEVVSGALGQFTGHLDRADGSAGDINKIIDELKTVNAPGVATAVANAKRALGFLESFKQNLSALGTHAGGVLEAFKAWDAAGRQPHGGIGKIPGMPPVRIKPVKKTRTPGTTGPTGSVGPSTSNSTAKNGVLPGTDKKKKKDDHRGLDATRDDKKKHKNGDGKQHQSRELSAAEKEFGPESGAFQKTVAEAGLAIALAQYKKGVREVGSSNTGTDVNKYLASTGLGGGYPWCAAFVRWCMEKAGFTFPKGTSWAACEQYQAEAAKKGTMFKVGHGDARPGDLIVWGGKHIGIVESRAGGTIHYVAGNQSDAVTRATTPVSDGSYTIIRLRQQ